jgi:putative sterol carrier protein
VVRFRQSSYAEVGNSILPYGKLRLLFGITQLQLNHQPGRRAMSDAATFFSMVPERVQKDKIQGMNATYQFVIPGEGGGEWYVTIANGEATVNQGMAENPNITLTIDAENFANLVTGKLNGQTAFLTGKLKIKGDMTLAMKLQSIFRLGA